MTLSSGTAKYKKKKTRICIHFTTSSSSYSHGIERKKIRPCFKMHWPIGNYLQYDLQECKKIRILTTSKRDHNASREISNTTTPSFKLSNFPLTHNNPIWLSKNQKQKIIAKRKDRLCTWKTRLYWTFAKRRRFISERDRYVLNTKESKQEVEIFRFQNKRTSPV